MGIRETELPETPLDAFADLLSDLSKAGPSQVQVRKTPPQDPNAVGVSHRIGHSERERCRQSAAYLLPHQSRRADDDGADVRELGDEYGKEVVDRDDPYHHAALVHDEQPSDALSRHAACHQP